MSFAKRRVFHLLFVLLLASGRHCVEHRIDWSPSGVEAVNHRVDVNLLDTVKLICFNNQSTVTYFYSSSDFIGCAINSSNILNIGHCGNKVIGGVVTLTIHGVGLPNTINYVENGNYNFTSVNNGECANGLWLTVKVVEHPVSITSTTTITAILSTGTSSFTSTTSPEVSGTRTILVSAVKTTSTDYFTSTQNSTPTVGGGTHSTPTVGGVDGNKNLFLSWPLGVKIGSIAGVFIAVFSIVCLVCLVVLCLVLHYSKKRRKEFQNSPIPEESIRPLFYEGTDSKGQRVALDGTKDIELTDNNVKTISSEETSKVNNSTENLEIKNNPAYSINATNGHSVSSPNRRPPPKPPTSGPSRPPPHKPTNSIKEPTSLPASSKPTNTGPASLPPVRNSPKATATVTPSSVQYNKSRRQAPAPPPYSLINKSNNKTKQSINNALRSV